MFCGDNGCGYSCHDKFQLCAYLKHEASIESKIQPIVYIAMLFSIQKRKYSLSLNFCFMNFKGWWQISILKIIQIHGLWYSKKGTGGIKTETVRK